MTAAPPRMRFRLDRHQTRRTASVMLFVWLYAMVASWANACILQPENAPGHIERSGLVAPHAPSHHGAADADASHQADPAHQACASLGDTEQNIVTRTKPVKGDGAAEPSALRAQVVAFWPAFTPGRAEVRWRPLAAQPPPGPPVAIAFLRLII